MCLRLLFILLIAFSGLAACESNHHPAEPAEPEDPDPPVAPEEGENTVPHLYIDTYGAELTTNTTDYIEGHLRIEGGDEFKDYEGDMEIKVRGQSTRAYAKKPFKIKLNEQASLLGLAPEKKWILLANYIDPSLMNAAIAMKIAELLGMPFYFHIIPVDVSINGAYWGSYNFCEQHEVQENDRIQVGENGLLFKLDKNFDRPPYQFKTTAFQIPVSLVYPDLEKDGEQEAQVQFNRIRTDFDSFVTDLTDPVTQNFSYREQLEPEPFVNFTLLSALTRNTDMLSPGSFYIYKKEEEDGYSYGPPWDFDRAYGFQSQTVKLHFVQSTEPMFTEPSESSLKGLYFFMPLFRKDPEIMLLLKEKWQDFVLNGYPELVGFITEYMDLLDKSGTYERDGERWPYRAQTKDPHLPIPELRHKILDWLASRIEFVSQQVAEWSR